MTNFKRLILIVSIFFHVFSYNIAFSGRGAEILAEAAAKHRTAYVGRPKNLVVQTSSGQSFSLIPVHSRLASTVRCFAEKDTYGRNYFAMTATIIMRDSEGREQMLCMPFCQYSQEDGEPALKVFSSGAESRHAHTLQNFDKYTHESMAPLFRAAISRDGDHGCDHACCAEEKTNPRPDFHEYLGRMCIPVECKSSMEKLELRVRGLYDAINLRQEVVAVESRASEIKESVRAIGKKKAAAKKARKKQIELQDHLVEEQAIASQIKEEERIAYEKTIKDLDDMRANLLSEKQKLYVDVEGIAFLQKRQALSGLDQLSIQVHDLNVESIASIKSTVSVFKQSIKFLKKLMFKMSAEQQDEYSSMVDEIEGIEARFLTSRTMALYHSESAALEYLLNRVEEVQLYVKDNIFSTGNELLSFTLNGHTWLEMCATCTTIAGANLNARYPHSFVEQMKTFFASHQSSPFLFQYVITFGDQGVVRCAPTSGNINFSMPHLPGDDRVSMEMVSHYGKAVGIGAERPVYQVFLDQDSMAVGVGEGFYKMLPFISEKERQAILEAARKLEERRRIAAEKKKKKELKKKRKQERKEKHKGEVSEAATTE